MSLTLWELVVTITYHYHHRIGLHLPRCNLQLPSSLRNHWNCQQSQAPCQLSAYIFILDLNCASLTVDGPQQISNFKGSQTRISSDCSFEGLIDKFLCIGFHEVADLGDCLHEEGNTLGLMVTGFWYTERKMMGIYYSSGNFSSCNLDIIIIWIQPNAAPLISN